MKCFLCYLDSVTSVRKSLDSFRHQQSHLASSGIANSVNKDLGAVILSLPPGVWPTKNDCVWLHTTQPTCLDPAECCSYQIRVRRMMDDDVMFW